MTEIFYLVFTIITSLLLFDQGMIENDSVFRAIIVSLIGGVFWPITWVVFFIIFISNIKS